MPSLTAIRYYLIGHHTFCFGIQWMYWFYFSSLSLVALVVLYLLWYYPNEQTTLFVKVIVGLAWFASLSVMVLLPEDVKEALLDVESEGQLYRVNKRVLGVLWSAVYWTTICFILCVLPFLSKYSDSGGFSVADRFQFAIRKNGILLVGAISVLATGFLILLLVEKDVTFMKFVGWLMAVLNAYGLIGAICLMGYGLVDIPRKLWQKANHIQRQNFLYQSAGMQIEKTATAHLELSKQINSVQYIDGLLGPSDRMRPLMNVIVGMIDRVPTFQPQYTEENDEDIRLDTDTRQGLGLLRQRLRKGIEGYQREHEHYLALVREYLYVHETIQNEDRRWMPFMYLNGRVGPILVRRLTWWWRCRLEPTGQRLLAIITGSLSLMIVLAEITIPDYLPNLSAFSQILQSMKTNEVALATFPFLILLYMMTCMYYTLIRLGRFSFYRLVPKHTAPFSLVSNALLLCRFVCPLCFNVLTSVLLPMKDDDQVSIKQTEFWNLIGERISETPVLGKYFTAYLPIVILPYVLLIACNGVNRVMSVLDPKLKFSFKDDWVLDMDSNYAISGRQMMLIEVENYQKGLEPGLTINEGLRIAGVSSAPPSVSGRNDDTLKHPLLRSKEGKGIGRTSPSPMYNQQPTSPFLGPESIDSATSSMHTASGRNQRRPSQEGLDDARYRFGRKT